MNVDDLRDLLRRDGFPALFEGHPDLLTVWTPDGLFVGGNPTMMGAIGLSAEQLTGMHFRDFFRSDDVDLVVAEFDAAAGGQRRQYLSTGVRPDGTVVRGRITNLPSIHDGKTLAVLTIAQDVGPLESSLAREKTSQELLRTAGELAGFGGWRIDLTTSETTWSEEIYALLGYPSNRGSPTRSDPIPASSEAGVRLAEKIALCAETGASFDVEIEAVSANGTKLRLRLLGHADRDESGAIVAVHGAAMDVTELEIGRRADTLLSVVLDSISDALIFVDREWNITYLNRHAEALLGNPADRALGRALWDVFPSAVASEFSIAFHQAMRDGRTVSLLDFSSPLQRWIDATAYPTGDGLALYLRDVTGAETAREDLRARNAEVATQSALLDNARDAIIVRSLDSSIRYWNASASRIYGWARSDVIGRRARDLLYAEPEQFDRAIQATLRDGEWSGHLRQIDKSGARLHIESSWTLVRDEQGEPESVFSISTDITERLRREAKDLRTQRMESLGTLASGIAHDLNNVLTPILMAVQLLTPGEVDPARREILGSTELAVKRGAAMIRQVLSFASGASGRRVPVDIAAVLADVRSLQGETLPAGIELRFEVAADLWPNSGDPTQLLQVLLNLLTNARDAMTDGGTIVIRAENITLADDQSSLSHLAPPGNYVQVEVEDSGAGMPPEVLSKAFEPFFTTKETGSGTGLGLSTSMAIIRGHGGYLQAYSEPGRGSIFRLHLPADVQGREADEAAIAEPLEELPRGHGELVLIVDDDAAIRQLTRHTLELHGYTTAVAGNGSEAIDFLDSGSVHVDLVLTDMAMPIMDGVAVAAYMQRHHPSVPVIATSGLTANDRLVRAKNAGIRSFLAKPYATTDLLCALAEALAPPSGTSP